METSEKFCLKWNDFESNISGAFRELREDKDFFDVTLACDDDQMQAHKVILSACSPFFRSILRRNKHEHPLLYLKGVKYTDLVSVLNFMYQGEVNVAQEELNSFLAVAEDLQVRGLSQKSSSRHRDQQPNTQTHPHSRDPVVHSEPKPVNIRKPRPPPPVPSTTYQVRNEDIEDIIPVKTEPATLPTETAMVEQRYPENIQHTSMVEQDYSDNNQQYQEGIMEYGDEYADYGGGYEGTEDDYSNTSALDQDENKALDDLISKSMSQILDENGSRVWNCDLCNKNNKSKQEIRRHMERHLQVQHQCPHCEKQVQTREALRRHISRYHKY